MAEVVIEAKDYSFIYEDSQEGIRNCNFAIKEGSIVLIAGDSGSGKSTLLKSLNGLIPHLIEGKSQGKLSLYQKDYRDLKMAEISKQVGSVFQNPRSQFFTSNSTAELVFAMENFGYQKKVMINNLTRISSEFNLYALLDRPLTDLSSGQKQLIALACARVLDSKILIFDEPSANLDYGRTVKLGQTIKELKDRGFTIIVADHRFYYLNNIVDQVLLFTKGQLEVFNSEIEFKQSAYNTRSFDLFKLHPEPNWQLKVGKRLVQLEKVGYQNILKDINCQMYQGEVIGIVGSNGAGKTTLAKLLTGTIKASSGNVQVAHLPFYVMQDADYQLFGSSLYQELTISPRKVDQIEIERVLNKFDLWDYKDKHPFALSGGQKQRLQIALAILSHSPIIIFDEPTSGLDVNTMIEVVDEVRKLQRKALVIVISHDYEFILRVCNRIIYLKDNTIKRDFNLEEKTIDKISQIYWEMEKENEN